jgi:hypothetical protein
MPTDFQPNATLLFREAFEGRAPENDYTWFVEKKEGIFDALESIDFVSASRKPSEDCSSIAGHAFHILYTLQLENTIHGGAKPEGTWSDSWKIQSVTEPEWADLKDHIKAEYRSFLAWFEANSDWSREDVKTSALSCLPHMAFHLGAIRQILKVL